MKSMMVLIDKSASSHDRLLQSQGAAIPSEERDAPESLKSWLPIWIGKTRSCGRIIGILAISEPGSADRKPMLGIGAGLPSLDCAEAIHADVVADNCSG